MASASARTCGRPGCRGVVRSGVCSACGPVVRTSWQAKGRGTRHARGYDAAWARLRAAFIEEKRMEAMQMGISSQPICEMCKQPVPDGQVHVDHTKEFHGKDDPLRLDRSNLRIMHARCHMQRTGRESRGRGG